MTTVCEFQDGDYSYQGADGHAQVYGSGSKKNVNGYASSDVASEGQRPKYIKTLYKHGSGVGLQPCLLKYSHPT